MEGGRNVKAVKQLAEANILGDESLRCGADEVLTFAVLHTGHVFGTVGGGVCGGDKRLFNEPAKDSMEDLLLASGAGGLDRDWLGSLRVSCSPGILS